MMIPLSEIVREGPGEGYIPIEQKISINRANEYLDSSKIQSKTKAPKLEKIVKIKANEDLSENIDSGLDVVEAVMPFIPKKLSPDYWVPKVVSWFESLFHINENYSNNVDPNTIYAMGSGPAAQSTDTSDIHTSPYSDSTHNYDYAGYF